MAAIFSKTNEAVPFQNDDRDVPLAGEAGEKFEAFFHSFWSLFFALYHALQQSENELTAADPFRLGLVDTLQQDVRALCAR